jgi:hypothetical protein
MLNNITNFFNLIKGRRIKTQLEDTDLIAVGTKQSPALGDYKPTAIQFSDLQAQIGGLQTVSVDGVTITGDGTPGDPLVAVTGGSSYKVYTALLTQTGTDAPVATVLENTLGGTLVWTRSSDGEYTATLIGAFPDENQFFTLNASSTVYSINTSVSVYWNDSDSFQLSTFTGNGVTIPYTFVDDVIYNYPIEIRVYN